MKLRPTIHDAIWILVALALAIGWWLDHSRIQKENAALRLDVKMMQLESDFQSKQWATEHQGLLNQLDVNWPDDPRTTNAPDSTSGLD